METPELSVILPVLDEAQSLAPMMHDISASMTELGRSWEVIFVDDGSSDGSQELIRAFVSTGGAARAVIFRKNYGQSAALEAGFRFARGRYLLPVDADLQNDPRDFGGMIRQLEVEQAGMIVGWRKEREDGRLRVMASNAASHIISDITGVPLHDHGCTMKVIRRDQWGEQKIPDGWHRFLGVLAQRRGMVVRERPVKHSPRRHGESHYGFGRIPVVAIDATKVARLTRDDCLNLQGVKYEIAEILPHDPHAHAI